MNKLLFTFFLVFSQLTFSAFGQDYTYHLPRYIYNSGDSVVITNGGNIRQAPSRNAKSLAQVEVGSKVFITGEPVGEERIFNMMGYYYPVSFLLKGVERQGYIWGGLLAFTSSLDKEGNLFAVGAKRFFDSEETSFLELNLIRKDVKTGVVYQQLVQADDGGQTYFEAKVLGSMGLKGVKSIFRASFLGEACGVSSNHLYFAWLGDKFVDLPTKSTVSDAGIFHSSDKLLFPTEHKYGPNLIIIENEMTTVVESFFIEDVNIYEETVEKTQRWFRWDGKSYEELQKTIIE